MLCNTTQHNVHIIETERQGGKEEKGEGAERCNFSISKLWIEMFFSWGEENGVKWSRRKIKPMIRRQTIFAQSATKRSFQIDRSSWSTDYLLKDVRSMSHDGEMAMYLSCSHPYVRASVCNVCSLIFLLFSLSLTLLRCRFLFLLLLYLQQHTSQWRRDKLSLSFFRSRSPPDLRKKRERKEECRC